MFFYSTYATFNTILAAFNQVGTYDNSVCYKNVIRMDASAVIITLLVIVLLLIVYVIFKLNTEKKIETKEGGQEITQPSSSWPIVKILKFVKPLITGSLESAIVYFDNEPPKKVEKTEEKETIIFKLKNFFKNLFSCKKGQKKEDKLKKKQIKQGKKFVKGCSKIGNVFKHFL